MSDLDKKLEDILQWFRFDTRSDMTSTAVKENKATRASVEQIKQALVDDGWKHDGFTDAVAHIYKKRAEGIEPTWVRIAGVEFKTGQEWYDRFEKEYMCQPIVLNAGFSETPKDWITRIDKRIKEAAKKAAGIS